MYKIIKKEEGVIALGMTIIVMFIGSTIALSLVFVFLNRLEAARNSGMSEQAYFAAESGVEDALLRFLDSDKELPATVPYNINVGSATATVDINDLPGSTKEIISDGDRSGRQRRVRTLLQINTDSASFFHGAQVGDGGLSMQNSSRVIGSVFSNGSITGTSGPEITGDTLVAGASSIEDINVGGNAQARTISNSSVAGEARADTLNDCTVGSDAYYDTSITSCSVSGTTAQEAYTDLEDEPMPVSDEKIEEWKQAALDGGLITGCSSGVYSPADQEVLGPGKIECDLSLSGNQTVFVDGFLWVEGNITMQNQSVLRLTSDFGQLSSAVIADAPGNPGGKGIIRIQNNSSIEGSGEEGSYLMMISMNTNAEGGGSNDAIEIQNGSASSIFYAPHGKITLSNNIDLVEVTAYRLELSNSAVIQYEQGLANTQFSAGPQAGYSVLSWEEE